MERRQSVVATEVIPPNERVNRQEKQFTVVNKKTSVKGPSPTKKMFDHLNVVMYTESGVAITKRHMTAILYINKYNSFRKGLKETGADKEVIHAEFLQLGKELGFDIMTPFHIGIRSHVTKEAIALANTYVEYCASVWEQVKGHIMTVEEFRQQK